MAQYTHSQVVRLTDEQAKLLSDEAERQGCSKSDVIRNCITEFGNVSRCDTVADTSPQTLALIEQLATKDEQIASLMRTLESSQETVRAAQALQAASTGGALAVPGEANRGNMSRFQRLRAAWAGKPWR